LGLVYTESVPFSLKPVGGGDKGLFLLEEKNGKNDKYPLIGRIQFAGGGFILNPPFYKVLIFQDLAGLILNPPENQNCSNVEKSITWYGLKMNPPFFELMLILSMFCFTDY
jgi:hypothetical protein